MPGLTEAQQMSFVRQVAAILRETAAEFVGTDLNPTTRATQLDTLAGAADTAEAAQLAAQTALNQATDQSIATRKAAYNRASATIDSVSGELGKQHALTLRLRNLRDAMNVETARGSQTPPAPSAAKARRPSRRTARASQTPAAPAPSAVRAPTGAKRAARGIKRKGTK